MSTKFWTGVALAVAGFTLALSPVIASASPAGAPAATVSQAAQPQAVGGVHASLTVRGRAWSGNPGA